MKIIEIKKGIRLLLINDNKFKTFKMGVYMSMPLTRENASKNRLLAKLLKCGTKKYPDARSINLRLQEMYGAVLTADYEKMGENHSLYVAVDAVSDKYTMQNEDMTKMVCELMGEIILNSTFTGFEIEKKDLLDEIRGIINNKRQYAVTRCIDEMCADEPYGIRGIGDENEVLKIEPDDMKEHYKRVLNTAVTDIIVTGAFDDGKIEKSVAEIFADLPPRSSDYAVTVTKGVTGDVKYITDFDNITQGKLVIGYRTNICDGDIYKLMVYNAIFGGTVSSKLFNNVREKLSLCYYASSLIDRKKKIMLVQAGIDFENYQKTLDEIKNQREAVINGDISDEEFYGSVNSIVNDMLSCKDSTELMMKFYSARLDFKKQVGIDETVNEIKKVSKADVIEIAKKISPDTVYFLKGKTEDVND